MDLNHLINNVYNGNIMNMLTDILCNSTPLPKLHEAVLLGDFQTVREMIQNGADLNHQASKLGFTPLFGAIINGNTPMLKLLINAGASVNIVTKEQRTPLTVALAADNVEAMRVLLDHGANFNVKILEHQSLLHMAVGVDGNAEIAELLITRKMCVNVPNSRQETPLHMAVSAGDKSIVELLLANGADVNAKALNLWWPEDEEFKFGDNITPLMLAVMFGHSYIAHKLVKAGADLNAETSKKYTALHFAVKHGLFEVVEIFLEAGSNVNAQTDSGETPLHIAVEKNHYYIACLLLKHKAAVDLKERVNGSTALFLAVEKEREEFVKLFVEKGANVNAANKFGVLPIHVAACGSSVKMVKLLLSNGSCYNAEAQVKNYSGSPIELARKAGNTKLIEVFTLIEKFFDSLMENDVPRMESCLEAGVIINARNMTGRTALHYAVSNGNIKAVSTLVANNADLTYASNKGNFPLHIAVANENQEIIEILLQHAESLPYSKRNFIVNVKKAEGDNSALHIAAKKNNFPIAELLVKNGAVYNAKNKAGKLPVQLTTNESIRRLLISAERLFEAVKKADVAKVLEVVQSGNTVLNARDADDGRTLLFWCVLKEVRLAHLFLVMGADCRLTTNEGMTPLHVAAPKGDMDLISSLVERVRRDDDGKVKKFINAAQTDGTVALHVASSYEVVEFLLQAGAACTIRNSEGKTASELSQNEDVRVLLKSKEKEIFRRLMVLFCLVLSVLGFFLYSLYRFVSGFF